MEHLQAEIFSCRICDDSGIEVLHPGSTMARGNGRTLMFIGIDPGNTELSTGIAFSGAGGKRLKGWLERVGLATEDEISKRCYFTSLAKCKIVRKADSARVFSNCWRYLHRQIELVRPKIVCPLGREPLVQLFGYEGDMGDLIGGIYGESDLVPSMLIPNFFPETKIVPLPHPSPLSRWMNFEKNIAKLESALQIIENEVVNE